MQAAINREILKAIKDAQENTRELAALVGKLADIIHSQEQRITALEQQLKY